jgi:hypothetical protein
MPADYTLGRCAQGRIALCVVTLFSVMIGSCAAVHESARPQQSQIRAEAPAVKPDYAWLDSVSFELYRCKRTHADGSVQAFYMVGEVHFYSAPTSRYADSLLARLQPTLLLSEGSDSSLGRSDFMRKFSTTMRGLENDIGRAEPELYRLARARGIPVVFLEVIDSSTGTYAGVTKSEKAGLEMMVSALERSKQSENNLMLKMMKFMLDNPEKVQQMVAGMLQANGFDTLGIERTMLPKSGIVDARNVLISEKAIQYILPENGCILIRFGMGHAEGMIEQLKGSNCDCEARSLQEFLETGT